MPCRFSSVLGRRGVLNNVIVARDRDPESGLDAKDDHELDLLQPVLA
jgi:hypothetical protein